MKDFNLEEAKAGKPVCTRNGQKVRILCVDLKGDWPIAAALGDEADINSVWRWAKDGYYCPQESLNDPLDLMMVGEKKKGWINIYKSTDTYYNDIYNTKEEALSERSELNYITTTEIEWEE